MSSSKSKSRSDTNTHSESGTSRSSQQSNPEQLKSAALYEHSIRTYLEESLNNESFGDLEDD